ncbi:MAG: hypothetical protein MUC95_07745 [Spirochaetes bacterium]|nr:hypothetical protein [Spirochaetota bacterium]
MIIFLAGSFFPRGAFAQEKQGDINNVNDGGPGGDNISETANTPENNMPSKNFNIDMLVLYGQYNYVLSTANISFNQDNFVSLLNTDLRRSNDFGYGKTPFNDDTVYANSSYYENKIGFTGNYNFSDSWKAIFDLEANNDSRGMFDQSVYQREWGPANPQVYSREEKDKFKLNFKTITKEFSKSSELYFNLGTGQYVHRLIKVASEDPDKSRVNQVNPEFGGEYIWSASNRIRFKTDYLKYDYSTKEGRDDWHYEAEVIFDLKMPRNFLLSLGLNFDANEDVKDSPYSKDEGETTGHVAKEYLKDIFIAGLSYKGMKKFSTEFLYRFDIVPFRPEEFYLEQKYIKPTFDLPPAEVHHSDIKIDYKANNTLSLKGSFIYEKNSAFYNYQPVLGNVLSVLKDTTIPVEFYNSGLDAGLNIYDKIIEVTMSYMYSYYKADENITYHPHHMFSNVIKFNSEKMVIEWGNKLSGDVYYEPDNNSKIPTALIGYLGIQLTIYEGFNFYSNIDNLYNNRYNIRKGYPEPGITLTGGLRILI